MRSRRALVLALGLVVTVVLLMQLVFFQVPFNQVAMVETFRKLDPKPLEPGLHAGWPWPVQRVIRYDNRLQTFEDAYEEFPLADKFQVLVSLYVSWRIDDPAKFRTNLGDQLAYGAEALRRLSTSAKKDVLSRYRLSNLVSVSDGERKLGAVEDEILQRLAAEAKDRYGIRVVSVGVKRLGLPPDTSKTVMETMRNERERDAQHYVSTGKAEAVRIGSEADNVARQILSFAMSKASDIRVEGDTKAAAYLARYEEHKGFAAFLRRLDFIRAVASDMSQFLLNGSTLDSSTGWFHTPPSVDEIEKANTQP